MDAGVNLALAMQRMGNDADLLRELASICIQDAPALLEQAANGIDARHAEESARAAHSLKGLASNFSAAVADAAHVTELALRSRDQARIERSLETLRTFVARFISELKRSVPHT